MSAKLCPQCGTRYEGDNRFCTLDGATLVLENPTDSLTGSILADRYEIGRKLGEGGMGEVYLAEHVRMKRKVAVKVMRAWLTKDPAAIGRFHREAENASQITHPNVAAVYDFGEDPESKLVYLAMEFVEGEPLTAVLERERVVNHVRASDIVSQTADALAAAHALGILHRDLKPDNVMIGRTRSRTDLVKLLDFGIARVMGRETQHFTSTGLIVGTPEWMSPEQIAGDRLDARSDIYTLGLIAFRMLTGEGAFSGATSQEVLLAKMTKPPRRLLDVRSDVAWPEPLQAAMDKVLATDPAQRYDDALAFAADFYAGVSQLPMTPEAEEYFQLLTQRAVTPARLGTIESTPVRGVPTHETPARPMPRAPIDVPQLANTTVLPAATAAGLAGSTGPVDGGGTTGSGAAVDTGAGVAIPSPVAPVAATPTRKKGPLLGVAALAAVVIIGVAVSQMGGGSAATTTADSVAGGAGTPPADSATAAAAPPDTTTRRAGAPPVAGATAAAPNSTTVTPVVSRPASPRLDSAASRYRTSVFAVTRGNNRATGFLADGEGMVLTASSIAGAPNVDVWLDPGRKVIGRVALVDSARGLAAVLIPTRHCPSVCIPLPLAPDRAAVRPGDTVMAVLAPTLLSPGARPRGTVTSATAQRLAASLAVGGGGEGAPVFLPDGNVLGVAREGAGRTAPLVSASVARAFLRDAQAEKTARNLQANDSLPPSWPGRPVSADDLAAGLRRTSADIDAFRVQARGDWAALVMTPQLLALRKAEADTMRKYFNPGSAATTFCDGSGVCDPLEAWGPLDAYLRERRGVVVIQVAPSNLAPPRRGDRSKANMGRRPVINQIRLTRGGTVIAPIETQRIYSVINPGDYTEQQQLQLYSALAVFDPNDLVQPGALEIQVFTVGGGNPVRLPIPATVVEGIRRDLASVLR